MITWCRSCSDTPVLLRWKDRRRPKCDICVESDSRRRRFREMIEAAIRDR